MAPHTYSMPIPTASTFGALLATFTLPDPDGLHDAAFGASVASANTNVLIGAPGKNGGTGEVYVFEGDTTQPTFGNLLVKINESGRTGRAPISARRLRESGST